MAKPLDPKEIVTLDELTISNMWEMAAIREVLEGKTLLGKPEILKAIQKLAHQNPVS